MAARWLEGKALARRLRDEVGAGVAAFRARAGRVPGLAAILVGDNPASEVYVRNKQKACREAGIETWLHRLPATATPDALVHLIDKLNADASADGILVQLPLPAQLPEGPMTAAVHPLKDVDGFTPESAGLLALGRPRFVPCTPAGIGELLRHYEVPVAGRRVVIVGRSNIVGKPLALAMLQKSEHANATVTVCHSHTQDLPSLTRQADILVAALGQPRLITADMVAPGAVVIDVGMNRTRDGSLVGDVDPAVAAHAAGLTPVPGGVGPLTIAMLLKNTLHAAEMHESHRQHSA
jgi:methylenetetrahydrofolate dehydrogenase (NADP+)/methenyltetrahydrofolate cyclohydrolase